VGEVTATLLRGEPPKWAASFSGDGDGYGYGYGDGYGYGYGYGYGDGYGDGDGDGYGDGDGDGYGYGDGDGDGDGYGYGYGYGDGDGDGDGYGDGYGPYWLKTIQYFAAKWLDTQRTRLAELQKAGATIAFWRSDAAGRACNGGTNAPVKPGTVEKIQGPLRICTRHALHATQVPPKWQGERVWIVALIGEIAQDGDKFGALEREVIGECL
jgi:hypothetical protein